MELYASLQVFWDKFILPIQQQAFSKHQKEINKFLAQALADYNEKLRFLSKNLIDRGLKPYDSLLRFRILEYSISQPIRLVINLSTGGYNQIYRELRFLLDSWVQAYYLDKENPNESKEKKLEFLEKNDKQTENRWYGKYLFKIALDKNKSLKKRITRLYYKFSQYVHSTKQELQKMEGSDQLLHSSFQYQPEEFEKCFELLQETHNILMEITFLV